MTKKNFFSMAFLCMLSFSVSAQYNFVVQNGSASVFKTLEEAYESSAAGDTIYLPGGSFNMPASIDKSLVWIGVGYHPDSTLATYFTRISSPVKLSGNCDNSYFSGIHFASNITMGDNGDDAVDVELFRCRIGGQFYLKNNDGAERDINTKIIECIFDGSLDANLGSNIHIEKSIIKGVINNFRSSIFDRIVLTHGGRNTSWGYAYAFYNTQNSLISNSVFGYYSYTYWRVDVYDNMNNNFLNNIFAASATFPEGTNSGSNNITSVNLDELFTHIDGSIVEFSYQHDFHLKPGSAGIGAGTEGTDIGLYGGPEPFKVGGLPPTPHIRNIKIDRETNNGILGIEIEAVSQDK
jgi:hypothetical protein